MKLRFLIFIPFLVMTVFCAGQKVLSLEQNARGVSINSSGGTMEIIPLADNAMRIRFFRGTQPIDTELILVTPAEKPVYKVSETHDAVLVQGKMMTVAVDRNTGTLTFSDKEGKTFLREKADTRLLVPVTEGGETIFLAEQSFESPADDYLFGLGQFQDGHYNIKNVTRRLTQVNSQIALPFVYSAKGYGLLWHQYGLTDFNPNDNLVSLQKEVGETGNSQVTDLTTTSGTQRQVQNQSFYTGTFNVPASGTYSLFVDYGDMENHHFVVIDDTAIIDQRNTWLPPTANALINLTGGEHRIRLSCKSTNNPVVSWRQIGNLTTFRSPAARELDYVVFYGPSADEVISAYRNLSGNVPMLPLWTFGFWQCRERYSSGAQLVETVKEFRRRNLPMDVIVQDWQYWGNNGWGVPVFDETSYPDPAGFIKEIHDLNAHFNISIWSNPDRNSATGKEYLANNLYIPDSKWLDYFNPVTRETYWNTLRDNLFVHGVDSWWMDATEPENDALKGVETYLGPGDFYRLTYPLFVSKAVYEGQRKTTSDKRVCVLTRSAFLGQHRYGTINWSGDIGGTWDGYRRQIVAGLNYTITGMPYWTTDIGGFFRPGRSQYGDEKYHELLIRWFQWGVFNPIFRIHGFQSETEPWKFGPVVENNMRAMLNLRYRLLPYIYSESYQVTRNGSTIMRPMVMDFAQDSTAYGQRYQFMFGKSVLVAPVTEPDAKDRDIYLPDGAAWYDFWSGERYTGGQTVTRETPLDVIPLFVKAGSVIPFGPEVQYATEKKWDNLEIRVYEGANGEFTLYEDENDNYNYEKGAYSLITFSWDNKKKTLTFGKRTGTFPGMLKERKFNIVLEDGNKGKGTAVHGKLDKVVTYKGRKVTVNLQR